jgi:predicted nucleotidyltransferase
MISLLEDNRDAVADLCRQYGVQKLAVFGSAVNGTWDPEHSDLDFVVDLGGYEPGTAGRYLDLIVAFEQLFERQVDIVTIHARTSPAFRREVEGRAQTVYERDITTVAA